MSRSASVLFGVWLLASLAPVSAQDPLRPVSCLIVPEETVRLATQVAGIVAEVLVERGDTVRAGDVVARLDATVEEIALALAETRAQNRARLRSLDARVAFLEAQLARNEQLFARNAVAETVVNEARLELEVARQEREEADLAIALAAIEVEQARALLDQKTLRAPIDGVVTERLLSPGEFRDTQSHIATIARLDVLRVEAFAPIGYFARLAIGEEVTIRPEEPIGGSHPATITIIDRVFDAATATFGVRIALPNPGLVLPAGLRCEVLFHGAGPVAGE